MKTKIYKSLGIEVTETIGYGKNYEECMKLKPKGWRLLTGSEALAIWEKEHFEDWFFVKQSAKSSNFVARFVAHSYGIELNVGWGPFYADSSPGVRFCRKLKEAKDK